VGGCFPQSFGGTYWHQHQGQWILFKWRQYFFFLSNFFLSFFLLSFFLSSYFFLSFFFFFFFFLCCAKFRVLDHTHLDTHPVGLLSTSDPSVAEAATYTHHTKKHRGQTYKFSVIFEPSTPAMGTGSFPGVKRPGRGADHPPTSQRRGHEGVGLYLYSPSGPSWPVIGRTFTFTFTFTFTSAIKTARPPGSATTKTNWTKFSHSEDWESTFFW
jgi:hypothetical protein